MIAAQVLLLSLTGRDDVLEVGRAAAFAAMTTAAISVAAMSLTPTASIAAVGVPVAAIAVPIESTVVTAALTTVAGVCMSATTATVARVRSGIRARICHAPVVAPAVMASTHAAPALTACVGVRRAIARAVAIMAIESRAGGVTVAITTSSALTRGARTAASAAGSL